VGADEGSDFLAHACFGTQVQVAAALDGHQPCPGIRAAAGGAVP
jgi:hypothetical protein